MVRPCVARVLIDLVVCGLASMYPAFDWSAFKLRAIMDNQRAVVLISGQALRGQTGHQGSIAPGRPVLHSLFTLADLGKRFLLTSLFASKVSLFSRAPFLRPSLTSRHGAARSGAQGWPSQRPCGSLASMRPRLEGCEHGAIIKRAGRHRLISPLRNCAPWQALPRRCARAYWQAQSPARCGATDVLHSRSKA